MTKWLWVPDICTRSCHFCLYAVFCILLGEINICHRSTRNWMYLIPILSSLIYIGVIDYPLYIILSKNWVIFRGRGTKLSFIWFQKSTHCIWYLCRMRSASLYGFPFYQFSMDSTSDCLSFWWHFSNDYNAIFTPQSANLKCQSKTLIVIGRIYFKNWDMRRP